MGPRQHPWSREGAFPNYLPLVVCPSSFNQANKAGKWDFEWQDPVVASILTPAGGGRGEGEEKQGVGRIIFSLKSKLIHNENRLGMGKAECKWKLLKILLTDNNLKTLQELQPGIIRLNGN